MREYEALFIIDPAKESSLREVTDTITGSIKKAKGTITKEENWGKQKIAHSIQKNPEGLFYKMEFSIDPSEIKNLRSNYKLNSDILRVMITTK